MLSDVINSKEYGRSSWIMFEDNISCINAYNTLRNNMNIKEEDRL